MLSEEEIVSRWESSDVVVSICMLTYNHASYIAEALEGILEQNVRFRYEILVHDDASTDGTADIVKYYAGRYGQIIKPIYQKDNVWTKGVNPSIFFNYPRVNGRYVAWCEGDDSWLDPEKLQMQVDILEASPEIDLCFHSALMRNITIESNKELSIGNYKADSGIVDFDDVFLRRCGMLPTASCIVRRDILQKLVDFMAPRPYLTSADIYMQSLGALRGGAFFIKRDMSLYRFGTPSSLTNGILSDSRKFVNHHSSCIRGCISMWRNYFPQRSKETLKKVVYKRLLWVFLNDPRGVKLVDEMNIRELYNAYLKIDSFIDEVSKSLRGKRVVIYGCGNEAGQLIKRMGGNAVDFVIDRDENKKDGYFHGVPFGCLEDVEPSDDLVFVISTMFYDKVALKTRLEQLGLERKNIYDFEENILELIDIQSMWKGEIISNPTEIFRLGKRISGWWERNDLNRGEYEDA